MPEVKMAVPSSNSSKPRKKVLRGFFQVSQILDVRANKAGLREYLVRWAGYTEASDTWEPLNNLRTCLHLVHNFEKLRRRPAKQGEDSPEQGKENPPEAEHSPDGKNGKVIGKDSVNHSNDSRQWSISNRNSTKRHSNGGNATSENVSSDIKKVVEKSKEAVKISMNGTKSENSSPHSPPSTKADDNRRSLLADFIRQSSQKRRANSPVTVERDSSSKRLRFDSSPSRKCAKQSPPSDKLKSAKGSSLASSNSDSSPEKKNQEFNHHHRHHRHQHQQLPLPLQPQHRFRSLPRYFTSSPGPPVTVSKTPVGSPFPPRSLTSFLANPSLLRDFENLPFVPLAVPPESPNHRNRIQRRDAAQRNSERHSTRVSEGICKYKHIVVRKCQGYTQIWIFTSSVARNSLNPTALDELASALQNAVSDDSRVVMISGSNGVFCTGVDLHYLVTEIDQKAAVQQLASALRNFLKKLISFPKPLIACVNGPAVGLGAAILPLCDVVYASDKASFYLPYSQLNQTCEGCCSFTFPQLMGMASANEMIFTGRKLTAVEACQVGLVSQVFWPTSMLEEVIPRIMMMASQSPECLVASKAQIRGSNVKKLELLVDSECKLLEERWTSQDCLSAMRAFLIEDHYLQ